MMGTYNLASWFVVLPSYNWQKYIVRYLKEKELDEKQSIAAEKAFSYMIFNLDAVRSLH